MGWNHSRVCSDLEIRNGVCDSNDDLSRKVSSNFGVPGFSDVITALEETSPDGVIVATPTSTHYEMAKIILENGYNLLPREAIGQRNTSWRGTHHNRRE